MHFTVHTLRLRKVFKIEMQMKVSSYLTQQGKSITSIGDCKNAK